MLFQVMFSHLFARHVVKIRLSDLGEVHFHEEIFLQAEFALERVLLLAHLGSQDDVISEEMRGQERIKVGEGFATFVDRAGE